MVVKYFIGLSCRYLPILRVIFYRRPNISYISISQNVHTHSTFYGVIFATPCLSIIEDIECHYYAYYLFLQLEINFIICFQSHYYSSTNRRYAFFINKIKECKNLGPHKCCIWTFQSFVSFYVNECKNDAKECTIMIWRLC